MVDDRSDIGTNRYLRTSENLQGDGVVAMADYAMLIDLDLCIGCNACTVACKVENSTPPGIFYSRVLELEMGVQPEVLRLFLPVLCNHCEDAPCITVCPTKASHRAADGTVQIDDKKCIGCRTCMIACPYHARSYTSRNNYYFAETPIPFPDIPKPEKMGIVQKCDFCTSRRLHGKEPVCVEACPTRCRIFGSIDDPNDGINELIASEKSFQLLPDEGTRPKVHYLSKHKGKIVASRQTDGGLGY